MNKYFVNKGGINGLGEVHINVNSQEFIKLQKQIIAANKKQSHDQIIENGLLSLTFQMERKQEEFTPPKPPPPNFPNSVLP